MSDSDDDDYMSDKLLPKHEQKDVRPGLLFNKSYKRTHEIYKRHIEERMKKPKTYHEQEKETREKGLNTAISSENIGFKLLQKMGYKEGKSLGKKESGIKEPVNIVLRESTSGVGREKHLEDAIKKNRNMKEEHLKIREQEYLAARHEKTVKHLLKRDYRKGQRICEQLDMREGMERPKCPYYWTKETMMKFQEEVESEESDSEEPEEIITDDALQSILNYLRETYWYCLYCGIKGTDSQDLEANCPGPYRVDHSDELE